MLARLPLAQTIYGGAKRVVLIGFPTPEMKAVGFVTKEMRDETTGRELAAVYVPASPENREADAR